MQIIQYENLDKVIGESEVKEKVQSKRTWECAISGPDGYDSYGGKIKLFGINILDHIHDWKSTGEKITITSHDGKQSYDFKVYTVEVEGIAKKFAADDSASRYDWWTFYIEKNE